MTSTASTSPEFCALIEQDVEIDAPPAIVFQSLVDEMNSIPDASGKSMSLRLEAMPGGRWFRDLGNNAGHLWGHVQVIKPPTLLEITGPLMMSLPVINHVTYRVTARGDGSQLSIKHRAFGEIDPRMKDGMGDGWMRLLARVKSSAGARH